VIDDTGLHVLEASGSSCAPTGDAWEEVLERMSGLGDAVVRWSTAAAQDPDAQQKLADVRAGLDDIAQKALVAPGRVARGDLVGPVEDGAEQASRVMWETAQQAGEAVAPYLGIVLAGLSDILGRVAVKLDEAASSHAEASVEGTGSAARNPVVRPSEENASAHEGEREAVPHGL
jgi:hypothetical protein